MGALHLHVDEHVHNLAHYGCDAHSIALKERRLLRAQARGNRAPAKPIVLVALSILAFGAGFYLIYAAAVIYAVRGA